MSKCNYPLYYSHIDVIYSCPYHYNSTSITTLTGAHSYEHSYLHKSQLAMYVVIVIIGIL